MTDGQADGQADKATYRGTSYRSAQKCIMGNLLKFGELWNIDNIKHGSVNKTSDILKINEIWEYGENGEYMTFLRDINKLLNYSTLFIIGQLTHLCTNFVLVFSDFQDMVIWQL